MIASNKQIVHMYVNALLPLAGGLIKQTTMAADWSVTFAVRVWSTIVYLLSRNLGTSFPLFHVRHAALRCANTVRCAGYLNKIFLFDVRSGWISVTTCAIKCHREEGSEWTIRYMDTYYHIFICNFFQNINFESL